jgi:ribosomal protein S8
MNSGGVIFQRRRDFDDYTQIANVIRSNMARLLTPFKTAKNPATLLRIMRSEGFLSDFVNRADEFCRRSCSQAAKIVQERTLLSEIREMPTVELAEEIRDDVFDSLDRPISGIRGLKDELAE